MAKEFTDVEDVYFFLKKHFVIFIYFFVTIIFYIFYILI